MCVKTVFYEVEEFPKVEHLERGFVCCIAMIK